MNEHPCPETAETVAGIHHCDKDTHQTGVLGIPVHGGTSNGRYYEWVKVDDLNGRVFE